MRIASQCTFYQSIFLINYILIMLAFFSLLVFMHLTNVPIFIFFQLILPFFLFEKPTYFTLLPRKGIILIGSS